LGPIGRELAAEGVDVSVLGANVDRPDYLAALKLRRFVRAKRIDVIHSHTTHALTVAALCRWMTPGVRALHTFHFGNYPHMDRTSLWLERIGSRMVDQLVAVGEVQRGQIKSTHMLREAAIETVPNGVRRSSTGDADPEFRARIGADGKILVGTIATLIPQKGLQDLLATARRVRDVRDDVHFVLIGEGDLRRQLEQSCRQLALDDVVTFTGWVENAAAVALPSFDIYFQPSLWEAMSISILEAMVAGKPVVTTRVGEAPHLIDDRVDGRLLQTRDVESMASAILELAGDAARRRTMGQTAARKVAEQFTVAHMARAYERLYLELATAKAGLIGNVAV
jgi:glycosyltransferase involved in cell wall biosynthesis